MGTSAVERNDHTPNILSEMGITKKPELEQMAAEIRLRAKRRQGEISKTLESAQGARTELGSNSGTKLQVLKAAGISKTEANRNEKLAEVPTEEFEGYIAKCKKKDCIERRYSPRSLRQASQRS